MRFLGIGVTVRSELLVEKGRWLMAAEVIQGGFKEQKMLSIKEAQMLTGRSLADEESRALLTERGAVFKGKGRGSGIPLSALEELGWVREGATFSASGGKGSAEVEALASEIAKLEKRIARNKQQIAEDTNTLRERKRQLTAITKAELRAAEKAAEEAVANLERLKSLLG